LRLGEKILDFVKGKIVINYWLLYSQSIRSGRWLSMKKGKTFKEKELGA
jgi:hypothetical protein